MRSYVDGMLRYFEFSGRSTRRQYWLFWLIALVLSILALIGDHQLWGYWPTAYDELGPLAAFVGIIHIVPGFTVTVRRLHDLDRSGWWYLIQLVPLLGALLMLYWMVCPPRDPNRFGPDPRDDYGMRGADAYRAPASTIPRQVRMGSAQPQRVVNDHDQDAQRFI